MAACCCYFQCALYILLPFYIGKVERKVRLASVEFLTGVDDGRFQFALAIEEVDDFGDVFHAIYIQVVDHGGFACILFGQDEAFETLLAGADSYGKGTFDGLQASVQAQFADDEVAVELVGSYGTRHSQYAKCQRQVIR